MPADRQLLKYRLRRLMQLLGRSLELQQIMYRRHERSLRHGTDVLGVQVSARRHRRIGTVGVTLTHPSGHACELGVDGRSISLSVAALSNKALQQSALARRC